MTLNYPKTLHQKQNILVLDIDNGVVSCGDYAVTIHFR